MEEGGPPLLIPRLEVDGGVAEEEFHHLLLATLGSLHQRGVALPVLGVGVDTLGQQGLDAGKVALSARPVELGLAQGTIQVRVDYLLLISNLLYSVLDPTGELFPRGEWRTEPGRRSLRGHASSPRPSIVRCGTPGGRGRIIL